MEAFKMLLKENNHKILILLLIIVSFVSCFNSSKDKLNKLNSYLDYKLDDDSINVTHFSKLHAREDYISPYLIHAKLETSISYYQTIIKKSKYNKCNNLFIEDCFFIDKGKYYLTLSEEYTWFDFSPKDTVYSGVCQEPINQGEPCRIKLLYKNGYIYIQIECIDFNGKPLPPR